jgi:hypothetical protein
MLARSYRFLGVAFLFFLRCMASWCCRVYSCSLVENDCVFLWHDFHLAFRLLGMLAATPPTERFTPYNARETWGKEVEIGTVRSSSAYSLTTSTIRSAQKMSGSKTAGSHIHEFARTLIRSGTI